MRFINSRCFFWIASRPASRAVAMTRVGVCLFQPPRHCEPSQTARQSMLFDLSIKYKKTTGSFLPVADRFA